jgi:hypothetical protein
MLFFRKLLRLPGAIELGKSDCDALPSRDFTPDCEGYTWEDWHKDVKEKYPIKYFFAETASDFIKYKLWFPIYKPIDKTKYWLISHIIPNKRYHMLDLRQPNNEYEIDIYRYGWCDVPEKMLFAMFNLLDQFVKHELPQYYCPPEEEIELKSQRDTYLEILEIHKWWTYDRKIEYKAFSDIRSEWSELHRARDPKAKELWDKMHVMEAAFENKTDEMISRLMKIRRNLWT